MRVRIRSESELFRKITFFYRDDGEWTTNLLTTTNAVYGRCNIR